MLAMFPSKILPSSATNPSVNLHSSVNPPHYPLSLSYLMLAMFGSKILPSSATNQSVNLPLPLPSIFVLHNASYVWQQDLALLCHKPICQSSLICQSPPPYPLSLSYLMLAMFGSKILPSSATNQSVNLPPPLPSIFILPNASYVWQQDLALLRHKPICQSPLICHFGRVCNTVFPK